MQSTQQYLQPGTILQGGRYKIIKKKASGGFGCAYIALYATTGETVVIKELFVNKVFVRRPDGSVSTADQYRRWMEQVKERFVDEANTLKGLNHPNIVNVKEMFAENNTLYYVMDLIDGASLYTLITHTGAVKENVAVKYITQIASALHYLHQNNILHLDVKPSNIMINRQGKAMLIDFGISVSYSDTRNPSNTNVLLLGMCAGYSSLELFKAQITSFSPASDVYSLAATLYFMLSGITPPSAQHREAQDTLSFKNMNLSPNVRQAIIAGMNLDPAKRTPTVAQFLQMLGVSDLQVLNTFSTPMAQQAADTDAPEPENPHKTEDTGFGADYDTPGSIDSDPEDADYTGRTRIYKAVILVLLTIIAILVVTAILMFK